MGLRKQTTNYICIAATILFNVEKITTPQGLLSLGCNLAAGLAGSTLGNYVSQCGFFAKKKEKPAQDQLDLSDAYQLKVKIQ